MSWAFASTHSLDLSHIGSGHSATDIVVETSSAVVMRIIVVSIGLTRYLQPVSKAVGLGSHRLI